MKAISNLDLINCKVYERDTRQRKLDFSIVFKERLINYALSLKSKEHYIEWDDIFIVINYKDKKKNQYEAKFEVIFLKNREIVFSLSKIKLKKNKYLPYIQQSRKITI